ncbi:electron transport complex subunit RsxB [Clostridium oryzae]|uniref:Electron transport complex subunit RsxB n=1 Tax=Clostridium oryzae TaxID=1450648 RepID=A0A1V4I9F5_9CLOT|nr:electron transport complex subunit RsxB [Clostridium oryzae]
MPGNNIVYYKSDTEDKQNEKISMFEKRLNKIISVINKKISTPIEKGSFSQCFFGTKILYRLLIRSFSSYDKQLLVNSDCTGCSICERVCPVANISMKDNKPVWHHRCEQCVACLNLCPRQAIQYRKITVGKKRYRNPFIKINELYRKD